MTRAVCEWLERRRLLTQVVSTAPANGSVVTLPFTTLDVNFDVDPRSGPSIYDMNILGYLGPAGKEAYVHMPPLVSGYRGWMVFAAPGTLAWPPSSPSTPTSRATVVTCSAKVASVSVMLLIVSVRAAISAGSRSS